MLSLTHTFSPPLRKRKAMAPKVSPSPPAAAVSTAAPAAPPPAAAVSTTAPAAASLPPPAPLAKKQASAPAPVAKKPSAKKPSAVHAPVPHAGSTTYTVASVTLSACALPCMTRIACVCSARARRRRRERGCEPSRSRRLSLARGHIACRTSHEWSKGGWNREPAPVKLRTHESFSCASFCARGRQTTGARPTTARVQSKFFHQRHDLQGQQQHIRRMPPEAALWSPSQPDDEKPHQHHCRFHGSLPLQLPDKRARRRLCSNGAP